MTPIIPTVPVAVWKNLCAAAETFRSRKPWEVLDDLDLIAVRDSSTGEVGYGAVMGNAGTLFGFCLYRGLDGFHMYRWLTEGEIDPEEEDLFALQDCLKLEFVSRGELKREDQRVISQLGLALKGKKPFPQFRSLIPEYAPWFLTEAEAKFLTLGLYACIHHLERIENKEVNESFLESECLVYTSANDAGTKFQAQWEPSPVPPSEAVAQLILNLPRITALREKKLKPDTPWEADMFYLPSPILDRERPYYMHLAIICHQSTGIAFATDVLSPPQQPAQALADVICSVIEKHDMMPETIFVKNKEIAAALQPLSNALGFTIRSQKNLRTITMLKNELYEQLKHGRLGR